MVPGPYTALSNDKKMVAILHRELERKIEKVKHMKLEFLTLEIFVCKLCTTNHYK